MAAAAERVDEGAPAAAKKQRRSKVRCLSSLLLFGGCFFNNYKFCYFFVHCAGKGTYMKTVSQKDRFLYHDSCRINASKLACRSFVKNHSGLQGEAEEHYHILHINGHKYDLSIDYLELRKLNRRF